MTLKKLTEYFSIPAVSLGETDLVKWTIERHKQAKREHPGEYEKASIQWCENPKCQGSVKLGLNYKLGRGKCPFCNNYYNASKWIE